MRGLTIVIFCLMVAGCDGFNERGQNGEYNIQKLFYFEGCSVYKFRDGDRRVYYTNCPGKTQSNYRNGKREVNQDVETIMQH